MSLRALSLWQPWAAAILEGLKRTETRDYPPPSTLPAGSELALHVAKHKDASTRAAWDRFRATWPSPRWDGHSMGGEVVAIVTLGQARQLEYVEAESMAAFVAAARPDDLLGQLWDDVQCGAWGRGRWLWPIENVRRLRTPVKVIGRQGVWVLSDEEERLTRAQLSGDHFSRRKTFTTRTGSRPTTDWRTWNSGPRLSRAGSEWRT